MENVLVKPGVTVPVSSVKEELGSIVPSVATLKADRVNGSAIGPVTLMLYVPFAG